VTALRIQLFELSRVGRAFAYGDSIEAEALGRGSCAAIQGRLIITKRRRMTPVLRRPC
jgi:hypothetical protein